MSLDPSLLNILCKRRSEVIELDPEYSDTRIKRAWPVSIIGELDQRMVLPHGQRPGIRSSLADERSRFIGYEGQYGLNLGVERKRAGAVQVDCGARVVKPEGTLARRAQAVRYSVGVPEKECCCINKHAPAIYRF